MRLTAVFPTSEIGTDIEVINSWATGVEQLGYSGIVVYDHVLGAVHADREPPLWGPYDESVPFHEPLTLLAYLAAITERVELATGVLVLPQRQTALVAKQAAQVDLLSRGRLRLGVGVGWNHVEYDSLGVPFAERGARLDEQIEVLRRLWADDVVDHAGRFHRIDRAGILPRPGRPIPIWMGGFTVPAFRRAARTGDGFILSPTTPDRARVALDSLRTQLTVAGRDPAGFPIEIGCAWDAGSPRARESIEMACAEGVSQLALNTMVGTRRWRGEAAVEPLGEVSRHLDALASFADLAREVIS